MLRTKERNECLYSLVYQYIAEKNQNKVYGREIHLHWNMQKVSWLDFVQLMNIVSMKCRISFKLNRKQGEYY